MLRNCLGKFENYDKSWGIDVNDLKNQVKDVQKHINLNDDDIVMDIGANDCTMISYFPKNLKRIGVEPAKNINWTKTTKKTR